MRIELALLALFCGAASAPALPEEDPIARNLAAIESRFHESLVQVRYRQRVSRSTSEPAEEVRARRVEQVVAVERLGERVDERQPRRGAVGHRDGDRAVQLDHRRGVDPPQRAVERRDLRPVGVLRPRGARVERGDRRLDLVRARRPRGERLVEDPEPLVDRVVVPSRAVLILEEDERAVRADAGVPPCVMADGLYSIVSNIS